MNLLIAIIGDTYGSVVGAETQANNYEKALLIVDYEIMLNDKQREKIAVEDFKNYLFYGDIPDENFDDGDRMRDKIDTLEENIHDFEDKTEEIFDAAGEDIKENFDLLRKEQSKLRGEINEYKSVVSSIEFGKTIQKIKNSVEDIKKKLK